MAVKRRLSTPTSPYLPTSFYSRSLKKSRRIAPWDEHEKETRISASSDEEQTVPESPDPYNYDDTTSGDHEEQLSPLNDCDQPMTPDFHPSSPESFIPEDSHSFGYITVQGWHTINDPKKLPPYVPIPHPTEEESEEEPYMKLDIWAADKSDAETSTGGSSNDLEAEDSSNDSIDSDDDQALEEDGEKTTNAISKYAGGRPREGDGTA